MTPIHSSGRSGWFGGHGVAKEGKGKVVGTGLLALDLVVGSDAIEPIGCWAGGTCGNVLAILAYLGWEAYPVSRINEDAAAQRVCADLSRWGVHLDWVGCAPTASTPIIVQEIRRGSNGQVGHRFSWSCPSCGRWLPAFKPITGDAVAHVKEGLKRTDVFFVDRLSRAAITLAKEASALGAVVVFEPSAKSADHLMGEAMEIAHVIKYAEARRPSFPKALVDDSDAWIEIQTMGERGLRYRHRFAGDWSVWHHLQAVEAPRLADTCGAGDWCTAGLIAGATAGGQQRLRRGGAELVRTALRYGQTLAAWNCGFEGARGGMYAVDQRTFGHHIKTLQNGRRQDMDQVPLNEVTDDVAMCPACEEGLHRPT